MIYMESVQMTIEIIVPSDQWVQITTAGEEKGSLYCPEQNTTIALTESNTPPSDAISDTPLSSTINSFENKGFFGLGANKFLYARAINNPGKITISVAS